MKHNQLIDVRQEAENSFSNAERPTVSIRSWYDTTDSRERIFRVDGLV
jgi:hypothetical protein